MTSVRLSEGVLDIVETGTGKPIVLLHSLLADRAIFDKIVPALRRQRRVIVPDLPGFGASSSAGATIEGIADRIAGLFDALGLGTTAETSSAMASAALSRARWPFVMARNSTGWSWPT